MKPILMFVVSFLLAAAASTGAKVALTKPPVHHTAADSDSVKVAADSTKRTDSTTAAPIQAGAPAVDSAAHPAVTTADSTKRKTTPAPALAAPAAPAATAVAAASDTTVQAAERRLAKVFTSMDAKQAAKVLDHMADSDVQIILGYIGPRQAAPIMAELPPERVAALSKLAMQGKKQ